MKQALEALERAVSTCFDRRAHEDVMSRPEHFINQTITALSTAIEEAEKQEPFGYFRVEPLVGWTDCAETDDGAIALYATTPAAQRQWVGLTPEQVRQCFFGTDTPPSSPPYWWEYKDTDYMVIYNAIEAKLKEKNHG